MVETQWVYAIKRKPDGTIEKYKPRKVRRGFTQEASISYDADKNHAQMMRPETLKILLVSPPPRMSNLPIGYGHSHLQALLHHDIYPSDVNKNREIEYWELHKALIRAKTS